MKKSYCLLGIPLFVLSCILLLQGCAFDGTPAGNGKPVDYTVTVEKSLPFIKTGATIATGTALKFSIKDDTKRTEVANQIWAAAHGTWTLTDGHVPDVQEFKEYVLAFGGSEATGEYVSYVTQLAALYESFYGQIRGDPLLAIKVLKALAEGSAAGAEAYVSVHPS
jgi:hypothetical protein